MSALVEDEFWSCALDYSEREGQIAERDWLVPGSTLLTSTQLFEPRHFLLAPTPTPTPTDGAETGPTDGAETGQTDSPRDDKDLRVSIREISGSGVLDLIGAHVWEAALLLSSYLLLHPHTVGAPGLQVLELGSGVALPAALLLALRCRSLDESRGKGRVCMTDHEPACLESLCEEMARREEEEEGRLAKGEGVAASVARLDWEQPEALPAPCDAFDIAIGSALCYSPDHVEPLLSTLRHLLNVAGVREVVVIQIHDRPGWARLVRRLRAAAAAAAAGELECACDVSLEAVPAAVYRLASRVRAEGGGGLQCKTYIFPLDQERERAWDQGQDQGGDGDGPAGLLTTPRADFALLRITRGGGIGPVLGGAPEECEDFM